MFPHYNTCWVDENGSDITSYMFLLPSACTPDQIELTVHDKKPEFTIKYTFPFEMTNLNIIMAPANLNTTHSKVAAFTKMFEELHESLDGKQKTSEFTIKLPFVVESEPKEKEINYFLKNTVRIAGQEVHHVMYVMTVDFIAKKNYKGKTDIGGGNFFVI